MLLAGLAACEGQSPGRSPARMDEVAGGGQVAPIGSLLPQPLQVIVRDDEGDPNPGVEVGWSVVEGGGQVSAVTSVTGSDGIASANFVLGPEVGQHRAQALAPVVTGSPVIFTATATAATGNTGLTVVGGGDNVSERFSSDLWVHGSYAYTGTWGDRGQVGNVLKVWSLSGSGAPTPAGSVTVPGISTVSDVQVSEDGQLLVLSGEIGPGGGIYLYELSDPAQPSLLGEAATPGGVHTVTLAAIDGRNYAFAAKNPMLGADAPDDEPALLIYDITDPDAPTVVHREPIPAEYGIHDTFVRDGIAFVFAWNTGVIIYDVGNGLRGGTPENPVEISRLITSANGICCGPSVHNGWWFHNPLSGERRYLFIGQEGSSVLGSVSSGDIHVVDVSDLANPIEVAFFHLNGAGTHNFWMDEERQILYAAYYNRGVIALDVSGTLTGNLSSRLLSQVRPGGSGNTFTWGVQLANGFLYAIDMLSGLWQLTSE